jgi:hypothetical protein
MRVDSVVPVAVVAFVEAEGLPNKETVNFSLFHSNSEQ